MDKNPTELLLAALQDAVSSAEFAMVTDMAPRSLFLTWLESAREAIEAAKRDIPENGRVILTVEKTDTRPERMRVVQVGEKDYFVQAFNEVSVNDWVNVARWSDEKTAVLDCLYFYWPDLLK